MKIKLFFNQLFCEHLSKESEYHFEGRSATTKTKCSDCGKGVPADPQIIRFHEEQFKEDLKRSGFRK